MVRPAREDETPKFGQVWNWGGAAVRAPMMAIAPLPDRPEYEGVWVFLHLTTKEAGTIVHMFWTVRHSVVMPGWTLLDDD